MNMNRKILFIIITLLAFTSYNNIAYAACSDVYNSNPYPTEEQCNSFTEDNFKCKSNGYTSGMVPKLKCEKSNECMEGYKYYSGSCKPDSVINANDTNNNNGLNNGNNSNGKVPCSTYTTDQQCGTIGKCEWNKVENRCEEVYVAEMPCSDDNIKIALRFFGYLLMIIKVAIPLIIIVMGTIDLFKSVIDKDDKSFTKQLKILLMRIFAGVFVFFLPSIVYALFGLSSNLNIVSEEKYKSCMDCLLKPTICEVSSENKAG